MDQRSGLYRDDALPGGVSRSAVLMCIQRVPHPSPSCLPSFRAWKSWKEAGGTTK